MQSPIISTRELELILPDNDLVIVDSRFDLSNPDWGFLVYQESHIPGAVYIHLNNDLSGKITPSTGRHPLPDAKEFIHRLGSIGISRESKVVIYDSNGGAFASRLWWMLRMLDHNNVYILDGGFLKWQRENRPLRSGVESHPPKDYPIHEFNASMFATSSEVLEAIHRADRRIIDARAPERYRGETEPIDPVAGHIPSAINRFHGLNLQPDGTFKAPAQLFTEFNQLLDGTDSPSSIVYCGSGVTSIHLLLAMEIAGLKPGKVYIGSWSEWIRDNNRPRIPKTSGQPRRSCPEVY